MYFKFSRKYDSLSWNYIEISDEMLFTRYNSININLPNDKGKNKWSQEKYPWNHSRNMQRLFLLCITFSSKKQVIEWMKDHLESVIMPFHHSLIGIFCYSATTIDESIDELIDGSEDKDLLSFIQIVLDRCLLWHNPDSCYPGDFETILCIADERLKLGIPQPLKWINNPNLEGVSYASGKEYIYVFYKYENLVKGITKGELYYNIKTLAKQAYLALIKSMSLFFDHAYKLTYFDEEDWERKFNEMEKKETEWCKMHILNKLT